MRLTLRFERVWSLSLLRTQRRSRFLCMFTFSFWPKNLKYRPLSNNRKILRTIPANVEVSSHVDWGNCLWNASQFVAFIYCNLKFNTELLIGLVNEKVRYNMKIEHQFAVFRVILLLDVLMLSIHVLLPFLWCFSSNLCIKFSSVGWIQTA